MNVHTARFVLLAALSATTPIARAQSPSIPQGQTLAGDRMSFDVRYRGAGGGNPSKD
jgi:hypothetical protein